MPTDVARRNGSLQEQIRKVLGNVPSWGPVPGWLPTGIDLLDWAIGHDGLPCGRVTEIHGPEGAAKTMIALCAARSCLQMGGEVWYFDVEHGLEEDWVRKNGIDPEDRRFHPEEPFYVEDALDAVELAILARKDVSDPTLIVYDTIAGGVAKTDSMEMRTMSASQVVGKRASLFTDFFKRESMGYLRRSHVVLLFLNHMKMGIPTGQIRYPRPTTPGGAGPKFAASVRIRVEATEEIKKGSDGARIGQFVNCVVVKNKVDRPRRTCSFPIFWQGGPDPDMGLIYFLVRNGGIKESGGWLQWEERQWRKNGLRDAMRTDPEIRGRIVEAARSLYMVGG